MVKLVAWFWCLGFLGAVTCKVTAEVKTEVITNGKANISSAVSIVGKAYSINGNKFLYTELYTQLDDSVWQVRYITKDEKLLAEKIIDYANGKIQPDFTIKNYWSHEISSVHHQHNKLKVVHGDLSLSEQELDFKLMDSKSLIVDAGFVAFVLQNWDALQQAKVFEYPFVVPSRLSTITMQTQKVTCQNNLIKEEYLQKIQAGKSVNDVFACFRSRAANAILRLIVSDIFLVFARDDKKLVRFNGLGNIADENGKMLKVDIHYTYF